MRNILLIMDYSAPYRGNFISSIEHLEKHWVEEGEFLYLFPDKAKNLSWLKEMENNGKKILFIDNLFFSKKFKIKTLFLLRKMIKNERIDIIHTHFVSHNYSLFIMRKLLCRGIKIIANMHNHYSIAGRLGKLKTFIMRNTIDLFIGDSESVSLSVINIGVSKKRVLTVRNSIDFSRLDRYQEFNFKKNKSNFSILMFGHPWHRKGVDIVVKSVEALNKIKGIAYITLCIAAAGYIDKLQEGIIQSLGYFPEWINILKPIEDLASYYNSADIFISAGREEGLSYSPIEASYCNCQVVCSNIEGNPLDIPGIEIYQVENYSDLIMKIDLCLSRNTIDIKKAKEHQRNYVINNYNIDNWAKQIIACYAI